MNRTFVITCLLAISTTAALAQYSAPASPWNGYRLKVGDTIRYERSSNFSMKPPGAANSKTFSLAERHTIVVDSITDDGSFFVVDEIQSTAPTTTYSFQGTVNQTGETQSHETNYAFAKIGRDGTVLGGNYLASAFNPNIADSLRHVEFRRQSQLHEGSQAYIYFDRCFPRIKITSNSESNSKWSDVLLTKRFLKSYDLSVAPAGNTPPPYIEKVAYDTTFYNYEVVGNSIVHKEKCAIIKILRRRIDANGGSVATSTDLATVRTSDGRCIRLETEGSLVNQPSGQETAHEKATTELIR